MNQPGLSSNVSLETGSAASGQILLEEGSMAKRVYRALGWTKLNICLFYRMSRTQCTLHFQDRKMAGTIPGLTGPQKHGLGESGWRLVCADTLPVELSIRAHLIDNIDLLIPSHALGPLPPPPTGLVGHAPDALGCHALQLDLAPETYGPSVI